MTDKQEIDWKTATEQELRNATVPWPKSLEELTDIVEALRTREHNYGTCAYAMSIAATAAFQYLASALGVTGFQASCADLDFLKRVRGYEHGFCIIDYSQLLYPQYDDKLRLSPEKMLEEDWLRKDIVETAKKNLETKVGAHQAVVEHWRMLVDRYGTDNKETN